MEEVNKIDSGLIKALTEPMNEIIKAVSKGIGKVYEPTGIVREAKARTKARVYEKVEDLVITELEARGLQFSITQLGKKQLNIDRIVNKALKQQFAIDSNTSSDSSQPKLIEEKSETEKVPSEISSEVHEDWIMEFFDLCQYSSQEDMQEIWAALLRMESTSPGTVSRRLMHHTSNL